MSKQDKNWSLDEEIKEPIIRTPRHGKPIDIELGDYRVRTLNVKERFSSSYTLEGDLEVSKIKKEQSFRKKFGYFGRNIFFMSKSVEWVSKIPVKSFSRQLYHPRVLAEVVVADLRTQGVEVNYEKTEELLTEALKPYV